MDITNDNIPVYTFYVDLNDQALISCPKCPFEQNFDVSKFKTAKNSLLVKCKCGEQFKAMLEYRRSYRKRVKLPGKFRFASKAVQGDMVVEDISLGGLRFCPLNNSEIHVGDVLDVRFKLDTPEKSVVQKKIKVTSLTDEHVGAKFLEDQGRDPELGLYLM